MEEIKENEDYITVTLDNRKNNHSNTESNDEKKDSKGKKSKNRRKGKKEKKPKKKWSKKKKIIVLSIIFIIILAIGIVCGTYIYKAGGNVKEAVLDAATDIVGEQDPIFVLVLGISQDISVELTDTIMLCGYNPSTQKAFMVSIPRDTFVGSNPNSADGYDKINALYQKSAESTVEAVELLTGVKIDYYVIVRNISITSIFECIGNVEFDVPIDMDYDDPTQDLHIHLDKGYQTLTPEQVEQLLRFRHNNDGSSYPSSYGDNDYGRMRTQREFLAAVIDQLSSLENIGKLKDIASMVYTNVQTNMSGFKVLDYVPYALQFSTSNLRSEQLPGKSALINQLWFYTASKVETRTLMDELMIYLELDDDVLESHYKYAESIKGLKPDDNYELEDDVEEEEYYTESESTSTNKNVDPDECDHNYFVYEKVDSTCDKAGRVVYKCTICSKEYSETTNPLGHNYVNGRCSRCGKIQDTGISNKDDNTNNNNNNNDTNNNTTNNKPVEHKHSYTSSITKAPTCSATGIRTYTCSCGASYTETISATGNHTYSGGVCTVCGEKKDPNYQEPNENPQPSEDTNTTVPTDPVKPPVENTTSEAVPAT